MGTGQRPTLPHAPPPPPPPPQPPPALPPLPQPEGEGRWALAELAATIGGLPSPSEVCWASYQSPSLAHAITAGGAEAFAFPPTHAGGEPIGWWQQRLALQRARDDGAPLAAEGWMRLQHRLIVWKLACLQRCLGDPTLAAARQGRGPVPSSSSSAPAAAYAHPGPLEMLSASGVHRALIGRYEREHVHGARPALRRLMGEGEARPPRGTGPKAACYRIWVSQDMGGASALLEGCMAVCTTLTRFHDPQGYCPSQPGAVAVARAA